MTRRHPSASRWTQRLGTGTGGAGATLSEILPLRERCRSLRSRGQISAKLFEVPPLRSHCELRSGSQEGRGGPRSFRYAHFREGSGRMTDGREIREPSFRSRFSLGRDDNIGRVASFVTVTTLDGSRASVTIRSKKVRASGGGSGRLGILLSRWGGRFSGSVNSF